MRHRDFPWVEGAAGATAVVPMPAIAQGAADFPNKPITLIMSWPAGTRDGYRHGASRHGRGRSEDTGAARYHRQSPRRQRGSRSAFKEAMPDPKAMEIQQKYDYAARCMDSAGYPRFAREQVEEQRQVIERLGLARRS